LSLNDLNIRRFQPRSTRPPKIAVEKASALIRNNLAEMGEIVAHISGNCPLAIDNERRKLLYLCSNLYDFYLLVEECLLQIARITDHWVPGSLDWHYRLIRLLRVPIPDQRPSVLSGQTANMLEDYLVLYVNFHQHFPKLSSVKIERMVNDLPNLYQRLEKELQLLNNLVIPGRL
jgi:hypothetical protein